MEDRIKIEETMPGMLAAVSEIAAWMEIVVTDASKNDWESVEKRLDAIEWYSAKVRSIIKG